MVITLENYCTMDDSQRVFVLNKQKTKNNKKGKRGLKRGGLMVYTHYVFHPNEDEDKYLAIIKPKGRHLEGKVLKEFVEEAIMDKNLIACTHYTMYNTLDDMIAAYTNKAKKKKFNSTIRKDIQQAHNCTSSLSKRILNNLDMEELGKAIKEKRDKIYVDGIEVILYGF